MIIDCISDLHGYEPDLPGGDLLLVAGDMTASDTCIEWKFFNQWLIRQPYRQIVYIGGNHDGQLEDCYTSEKCKEIGIFLGPHHVEYLCDNSIIFEDLKIYGLPWTPTFYDWHFMKDRGKPMKAMVDLIPDDVDILLSHGPAYGCLDQCLSDDTGNLKNAGCRDLAKRLKSLKKLKLHVFGHIHEGYGFHRGNYLSINASIMDGNYNPVNKPYRIRLEETRESRWEEIRMDSLREYPAQLT